METLTLSLPPSPCSRVRWEHGGTGPPRAPSASRSCHSLRFTERQIVLQSSLVFWIRPWSKRLHMRTSFKALRARGATQMVKKTLKQNGKRAVQGPQNSESWNPPTSPCLALGPASRTCSSCPKPTLVAMPRRSISSILLSRPSAL